MVRAINLSTDRFHAQALKRSNRNADNSQEPTWTSRTHAGNPETSGNGRVEGCTKPYLTAMTTSFQEGTGSCAPVWQNPSPNSPAYLPDLPKPVSAAGGGTAEARPACMGVGKSAACNLGLQRSLPSLPGWRPRALASLKRAAPPEAPRAVFPTHGSRFPSYRVFWHP